ncbi:MAG: hypothetical protein K2K45_05240 [Muribaculaceae bacterium]|nr:hypothetical protein [Muribaculaceae bacterium]
MADGKLVFPVKFDLEAAVKEASGDADRVLKRLGTMINSRPLKLGIEIEQPKGGWDKKLGDYGKGSINAMRKEMAKLVEQWNKLSEAQRITDQKSGAFTADAMKIINRYGQLVTASESYARSLEQIASAAKKSADAEIRANQKAQAELEKRMTKSKELVAVLKNEENSVSSLTARLNFYTKQMNSADKGSKKWVYNSQMVQQLKEQLDRLYQTQKKVTDNDVKTTDKRLQERARIKSALLQEENSIDRVNAKLNIWHNIMNRSAEGSGQFAYAAKEIERLNGVMDRLNANTPKAQQKAQEQLQREWLAAKDQREREREKETQQAIANANRENQARQAAFNAQRQAGLERQRILNAEANSIAIVTQQLQIQQERLNNAKVGSAKYNRLTEEVDRLTRKLNDMQEALQAAGKRVEALRALREILAASEKTISGLTGKLQVYQERLKGLESGSQKFNKTAAEVRRLSEELQRANQYLSDFQSKAFRGLSTNFTAQQTEAVQNLRRQIDEIDKRFNMLYQNGRATKADGTYTDRVNAMLKERMRLTEEINKMMKTAADAQLEREKEINRLIERRNARNKEQQAAYNKVRQAGLEQYRILKNQEKTISEISAKLQLQRQRLNNANMDSSKFKKIAAEVERLTWKLENAQRKVAELTGQSTSSANTQKKNIQNVNQEYSRQLTYLEKVMRKMAVYGSIGMIGNLVRNVREVTAQFELQRVSLGAILQDQTKANQLFSEIKGFALKSPVSILDLTKYTKQLAAYKIGYDELFETTKKLTDVSVGLGVSMDRVVLAYGQVRATGHLRASEIRQFTEMGVPIVEELAAKLSKMNGELVTAADVMDMVSKRAIGFDMVKEVFDDMTSAGGIFYNMQEKQGNTLYGLWAKLGDAASVMYDEIGRTGPVNSVMKGLIQSATDLMKNWRLVSGEVAVAVLGFGAYKVAQNLATKSTIAASAAADNYTRAQIRMRAATIKHNEAQRLSALYSMKAAQSYRAAALSTNVWTAAKYKLIGATNSLKAALMGNWITLAITAIAAIAVAIGTAVEKATRLKRALAEIREETTVLQNQSVRNFERLAKQATENADGSKKQKEALDELNRTYKDMVPEEALKIENLRKMKGNYEELTQAVREYIAAQQEEKSINTINEQEGAVQTAMQKRLRGVFEKQGLSSDEIERFFRAFERTALDASKTVKEQFEDALEIAGLSGGEKLWEAVKSKYSSFFSFGKSEFFSGEDEFVKSQTAIGELSKSLSRQQELNESVRKSFADLTQDLGVYTGAMRNYNQAVQDNLNSGETMLQNQENVNMQIRYMTSWIKDAVKEAGIAWNEGWAELIMNVDAEDLNRISSLNMDAILSAIDPNKHLELYNYILQYKKMYEDLIPSDPVARAVRAKFFKIAQGMKDGGDAMRQYLWDGKQDLKEHIKTLGDAVERIRDKVYKYSQYIKNFGVVGKLALQAMGIDVDAMTAQAEAIEELMKYEQTYVRDDKKDKGGRQSDPRLQNLKEEISLVQKLYQEYKQLEKQEGATKATADMNRMAKDTIAMLSKKYGIGLPKTANDVVSALEILYGKMEQLPKKSFSTLEKDLKELRWTIEKVDIDDSQKNIEAELKKLADRISRTKTAKEFYDKILSQTGDIDLAMNVTMSVYGDTGEGLFDNIVEQIRQTFSSGNQAIDLQITAELDTAIDTENQRINYQMLADIYDKYQDQIIEKNRQTAENIIKEGQKTAAANISTWEKELAKAKDFEQQRTDIINRETQRRADIYKSNLPQEEKDRLAGQSRTKQSEDLAKVNFEEFTKSEDYIKIFENLDNTSTAALKRLREEMRKLIETNKDLSPENMKTLVKAMEDIDEQISGRGFGNDMVQGVRDYIDALRDLKTAKAELKASQAEYDEQLPQLDADIDTAKAEEIAAQEELNALKANELATENQIVAAELRLNNATKGVQIAEQSKAKAADKVKKAETKVTNQQDKQKKASGKFFADLQKTAQTADQLASVLGDVEALLAISADSAAGVAFDSAIEGLQTFSKTMNVIIGLQELYNIVTESNPWIAIAAAVLAVGSMLGSWITNNKVRKANLEIERQQELLEGLQYTYSRLQKVADKLFGRDYIDNYNQQLRALEAEAAAYQKQAEAEKSKGKKTDKEKLKEYENSYRDTMDEIADMQTQLVEKFTGTNRQDVARQMAQSWIDARVSMSDTFAAIKGDYSEMIKNMIVEGAAARIIENALTPMWDKMDAMLEDNDIDGAIDSLIGGMDDALNAANNGMEVLWKALEARGYDMKQLIGDTESSYTGIAKNVATATSEEINANTAALNTQNYYLSQVPVIGENVAAIRMILQGGSATVSSGTGAATTIDYTDLLTAANQHLASLPRMERHLSDIYTLLNRVVVYEKGKFVVSSVMRG